MIKIVFIAPHLSFKKENSGQLVKSQTAGKATPDNEIKEKAHAVKLCKFMVPTETTED